MNVDGLVPAWLLLLQKHGNNFERLRGSLVAMLGYAVYARRGQSFSI